MNRMRREERPHLPSCFHLTLLIYYHRPSCFHVALLRYPCRLSLLSLSSSSPFSLSSLLAALLSFLTPCRPFLSLLTPGRPSLSPHSISSFSLSPHSMSPFNPPHRPWGSHHVLLWISFKISSFVCNWSFCWDFAKKTSKTFFLVKLRVKRLVENG